MTPSYLFSISSFFDCLDEDQADILWDSVETLDENDQDLTEGGPHVFQLSGWGEPVTEEAGPIKRKKWSCWCAAHKPQSRVDTSGKRPLIVLEFEPVFDTSHPLSTLSAPGTPEESEMELETGTGLEGDQQEVINGKSNGSGSANTNSTLRDMSKNHNPYFSAAPTTASSTASVSTETDSQFGSTSAAQSLMQAALTPGGSVSSSFRKKPKGGVQGEPYQPTAEEFAESTTVSSKPLKALARMRKERHSERRGPSGRSRNLSSTNNNDSNNNNDDASSSASTIPNNSAPKNRRRRPNATGPELDENGFGTGPKGEKYDYGSADPFAGFGSTGNSGGSSLDMFGVLSQANEQLSAQTDLQSFLKVVVGIIREMTSELKTKGKVECMHMSSSMKLFEIYAISYVLIFFS